MVPMPNELEMWIDLIAMSIPVLLAIFLGLLGADMVKDDQAAQAKQNPEAYDLTWKQFFIYAFLGTLCAMALLQALFKDLATNFWTVEWSAAVLGLIFRFSLPKIIDAASKKFEAVIEVMFK